MDELALLRLIADRSADLPGRFDRVVVGPGDDCAVLRTGGDADLLASTDQLIEGAHFQPATATELIARKAVARSLSDLAAMAATPAAALVAAALPPSRPPPFADDLIDAMSRWSRHWSCPIVGGDIAATPGPLTLTVTVLGTATRPVLRSTARAGQRVFVTGRLGGSLASGRHLDFEPRLIEARWLHATLSENLGAMIDLSDGLGLDAQRIADASGVRIELDAALLPLHRDVVSWQHGLGDGEDYELCFTASGPVPERCPSTGTPITPVGRVVQGGGCVVLLPDGSCRDAARFGFVHRDPLTDDDANNQP